MRYLYRKKFERNSNVCLNSNPRQVHSMYILNKKVNFWISFKPSLIKFWFYVSTALYLQKPRILVRYIYRKKFEKQKFVLSQNHGKFISCIFLNKKLNLLAHFRPGQINFRFLVSTVQYLHRLKILVRYLYRKKFERNSNVCLNSNPRQVHSMYILNKKVKFFNPFQTRPDKL